MAKYRIAQIIAVSVVAAGSSATLGAATVGAKTCSNATFCGGWDTVCKRTLPAGGSASICQQRYSQCLSSGCYFFNVPRPRCKSNATDLALTTACQR